MLAAIGAATLSCSLAGCGETTPPPAPSGQLGAPELYESPSGQTILIGEGSSSGKRLEIVLETIKNGTEGCGGVVVEDGPGAAGICGLEPLSENSISWIGSAEVGDTRLEFGMVGPGVDAVRFKFPLAEEETGTADAVVAQRSAEIASALGTGADDALFAVVHPAEVELSELTSVGYADGERIGSFSFSDLDDEGSGLLE